jgi:LuxR family maltose regulon positive regulatory protein
VVGLMLLNPADRGYEHECTNACIMPNSRIRGTIRGRLAPPYVNCIGSKGIIVSVSLAFLVPTKMVAPQPGATWIRREQLLAQLGSWPTTKLTTVIASAGFGKSTLVSQWLTNGEGTTLPGGAPARRFAWLTLDVHDQDGVQVLAYLVAAIEQIAPQALTTTTTLLLAPETPPLYVLVQALLVDLNALAFDLVIVLDDYHTIMTEAVHQAVMYLLRHLPPHCRLVILSRIEPPLQLARLRAEQQVTEVRTADLRFSEAESRALFDQLLGGAADATLVNSLHQQTEGWPIALQLAALSPAHAYSPERPTNAATRHIAEYLTDEVFAGQPQALQQALLLLAVPERFCVGVYAALADTSGSLLDAESVLDQIRRANLFLIPLDREERWYRFHHLFRDLLLRRLQLMIGLTGVRALQRRVAQWFAAENLFEEAVRFYLMAGAESGAAELVEQHLIRETSLSGSNMRLDAMLRPLPDAIIAQRPGLTLIATHLAAVNLDLAALEAGLARVDALLAAAPTSEAVVPWPTFHADLMALRGIAACWQGRSAQAVELLSTALQQGVFYTLVGRSCILLGLAQVGQGQAQPAAEFFKQRLPAGVRLTPPESTLYQHASRVGVLLLAGECTALLAAAPQMLATLGADKLNETTSAYLALSFGIAAYECSDLAAAARYFGSVVPLKYQINHTTYMSALTGLALTAAAQGAPDDAERYAQSALQLANEIGGAFFRHQAVGCAVRLALLRGDPAAALHMAQQIAPDIHLGPSVWFETPRLSQAQAFIASGREADVSAAEAILTTGLSEVEPLHNVRLLVRVLALQALLHEARGRRSTALMHLQRAVELAAPHMLVRALGDLGAALHPLIRNLSAPRSAGAYLERVLALAAPAPTDVHYATSVQLAGLPELLTRRELEILVLLAERWSDKEIAERLVIAPNTVRKHTSTIYDKLGIHSRREAVEVARALGLLSA